MFDSKTFQDFLEAHFPSRDAFSGLSWKSLESSKIQARRLQTLCSIPRLSKTFLKLIFPLVTPSRGSPGNHLNPAKSKQEGCKPYVRFPDFLGAHFPSHDAFSVVSWKSPESSKIQARRLQTLCSIPGAFCKLTFPLRTPSWTSPGSHLNPAKSKQDACKPYVRFQELFVSSLSLSGRLPGPLLEVT